LALVLSLVAMTGVYAFDPRAFNYTIVLFIVGAVYYFAYGKNHLVAKTADEELSMVLDAESVLDHESEEGLEPKPGNA
jgi:ethanolamine permease